jgi:ribosomal protein S14
MHLKKINKDKIRRFLSKHIEVKLIALNYLIKCFKNLNVFSYIYLIINLLDKNFFFSKVNNLCILTGRQSGVYKVCRISRIELRNSKHDLYGFRKSS